MSSSSSLEVSGPLSAEVDSETISKPIDVLIATWLFHPVYSGPGERFRRYAPRLRGRGVNLRVFAAAWVEDQAGSTTLQSNATTIGHMAPPMKVDGIRVDRVFLSREMGRVRMFWTYFQALRRYINVNFPERPDAVQFFILSHWAIPCLMKLKRLGIPLIYVQTMVRDPSVAWYKNLVHSLPLRFMDRTVVSSAVMGRSARKLEYARSIEVIPNGVDLERFAPLADPTKLSRLRRELDLPESGELVAFIGGYLQHRKGIDILADAWSEIARQRPDAWLVLVGPRENDMRPSGPQRAFWAEVSGSLDRSGARDRVIFTGRVTNVEDYLRATDVFVFPSRREGMPNVVPEAFGCGVASVLAPFVGFPDEFGVAGREFVKVPHSSDELARAVVHLLGDPERRKELGRAARQWVEDHMDVERSLHLYSQLYTRLASPLASQAGLARGQT